MGLLDDFLKAVSGDKQAAYRAIPQAAQFAAYVDPGAQVLLKQALLPWFQEVCARAPRAWYHPSVSRHCDKTNRGAQCTAKAVGMCSVCHADVCMTHAWVGLDASIVCRSCIEEARKHVKPIDNQPPPWEEAAKKASKAEGGGKLEDHYKTLGVEEDVTDDELEKSYKALLKRWHPDRVSTEAKKAQYERKFKQIRAAYDAVCTARKAAA
jgi:hypothetical protein